MLHLGRRREGEEELDWRGEGRREGRVRGVKRRRRRRENRVKKKC